MKARRPQAEPIEVSWEITLVAVCDALILLALGVGAFVVWRLVS